MDQDVIQRRHLHDKLYTTTASSPLTPQLHPAVTSGLPSFYTPLPYAYRSSPPSTKPANQPTENQAKKCVTKFEQEINLRPGYETSSHCLEGQLQPRTFRCTQCFKSTESPRLHLHHLVQEHGLDLTIYECDACDFATKYKQKLLHHRSTHQTVGTLDAEQTGRSDMLGSSNEDDSYREKLNKLRREENGAHGTAARQMDLDTASSMRVKDINENVKHHSSPAFGGTYSRQMEPSTGQPVDEQDLLCNESVANTSAEFESKSRRSSMMGEDEDRNNLVIDLGDNRNLNSNQNNNNIDATPAILRAVSLATATSMVPRPSMVPVGLSHGLSHSLTKRDLDIRPSPGPTPPSGGAKLTKKGTVPVREAVDPAKYVRLHDVDGVRYACSKCGNVYKWRKSLNKHWKEKHDGEVPVPASGSFSSILNIPHIKGGPPQYSTPKSSTTSTRTFSTPSPLNSSGAISSFALDKYMIDMGAQSGGRSIQSYHNSTTNSQAAAAAAAAVMASRSMLAKPGNFNSMLHANIPFAAAAQAQHMAFGRFMKPETTVTTNVLPKFPHFSPLPLPQGKSMRLPTVLPPAAHSQGFLKNEVLEDNGSDDMPLDLSKKSAPSSNILDLTSPAASMGGSRPGSSVTGDQPLDFSVRSNPGSECSTPVQGIMLRDREDLQEQSWGRATSTPESDLYNSLQCYKCPFVAGDKASFEEHLEQHSSSNGQYPQCAQCKQHFSSNDELTQHFGLHHLHSLNQVNSSDDDSHSDGAKAPGSNGQLYQYLTKAQENKEHKCVVCNARFPWQRDLARHFTNLHADLPNPYSKKRPLENDSIEHEPWHKVSKFDRYGSNEGRKGTSEGELECEQCTFVARDVAEMSRHQLVHSFNRPHACTMCGFSSKSREELQSHMWKYHPNQAEEMALMASSGGVTPVSLSKSKGNVEDSPGHNASNTSGSSEHSMEFGYDDVIIVTPNTTEVPLVRARKSGKGGPSSSAEILLPYKCSVCEYRARWPSEITQHMKNHSDEKPYHCPRCTYKSKWKWDVVKHLKRCGGGTVKDVIDTTTGQRRQSEGEEGYHSGGQNVVKQLHFQSSSPNPSLLSNGPPNVTVLQHDINRSSSPISSSSDVMPYSRNTSSPANSISSEPTVTDLSSKTSSSFHANQAPFNCLQCPFTANSPAELRRHCRVHSDEKPFTCQTCGYSTKWKCDLKKHVRTYNHHLASEDKSDNEDMSSSDELGIDMGGEGTRSDSPVRKPTLYKCEKCQYVTYKKNLLDGHLRIHRQANDKSGKLKCKKCDHTASDLSSFLQHKLTHSTPQSNDTVSLPESDAVAVDFSKAADRESSPQRHRRKPVKYHMCNQCPYNCLQPEKLEIHQLMHDPRGPGSLPCEFCDYNVYNKALLMQHMKLHPEYKEWCNAKGKDFQRELEEVVECMDIDDAEHAESLMDIDESLQQKSKNGLGGMKLMLANPTESAHGFQCGRCTFSSGNLRQFEDHIQKHGAKRKVWCEHCDWSSETLKILYEHVLEVHPQQLTLTETKNREDGQKKLRKPQACADCGYISDNASKMASHKLKHESEKEKKCHYCSQTMSNAAEMQDHLQTLHDVEINGIAQNGRDSKYTCDYCNYAQDNLNQIFHHMKMCHTAELNSGSNGQHASLTNKATKKMSKRTKRRPLPLVFKPVFLKSAIPTAAMKERLKARYRCSKCPFSTGTKTIIAKHRRMHALPSKYKCRQCGFSSARMMDLNKHLGLHAHDHQKALPPKVRVVLRPVTHKILNRVKKQKQEISKKLYNCKYCPYATDKRQSHESHTKLHGAGSRYQCRFCNYTVERSNVLHQHERLHEADTKSTPGLVRRKFRCVICPYHTNNQPLLGLHTKMHSTLDRVNGIHKLRLEPTLNNNNTVIKMGNSTMCKYCERDFPDASEKEQHEQQHLVGSC